ncbi:MAG TPA: hypothetical protein VGP93_19780 [Polyangiaceae bacterium]|nr:hypothetical protein [Polyangiaceae bacterium]
MLRWAVLFLPLTCGSAALGARAADALGSAVAAPLIRFSSFASSAGDALSPEAEALEPAFEATVSSDARHPSFVITSKRPRLKPAHSAVRAEEHAIFVSAETVLRLAQSSARPRGSFVPTLGKRPAGLRLSGVSALGIGVRDGDVLTEVAGQPALEASSVIEAVLVARAAHRKLISGAFYRGDQRFTISVEQPYGPGPSPRP